MCILKEIRGFKFIIRFEKLMVFGGINMFFLKGVKWLYV